MFGGATEDRGCVVAISVRDYVTGANSSFACKNYGNTGAEATIFARFALEKITRTQKHRDKARSLEKLHDASSWSRNVAKGRYAGCVVFRSGDFEVCISISAYEDEIDEALAYHLGAGMKLDTSYAPDKTKLHEACDMMVPLTVVR